MQPQDYATIAVSVFTLIGGFTAAIRWLVKHFLNELRPNSGSSLKDQVNRLESRVDDIYRMLCEK